MSFFAAILLAALFIIGGLNREIPSLALVRNPHQHRNRQAAPMRATATGVTLAMSKIEQLRILEAELHELRHGLVSAKIALRQARDRVELLEVTYSAKQVAYKRLVQEGKK